MLFDSFCLRRDWLLETGSFACSLRIGIFGKFDAGADADTDFAVSFS
ncbi:hypothetical protein [Burkholderia pyrrocinia]|nr:hypothetical protein [Burkholderia pyrrocinia]